MPSPTRLKPAAAPRPRKASRKISISTRQKTATVEYPDGSKQKYTFQKLEETYNDLKNQRTKLSAELGDS